VRQRGRPRHDDILTPREWEVLKLLLEGLTNEQIADRLGVTHDTAKYHVSQILGKLGVESRQEAARWAERQRRLGVLGLPSALLRKITSIPAWKLTGGVVIAVAAIALTALAAGVLLTDTGSTPEEAMQPPVEGPRLDVSESQPFTIVPWDREPASLDDLTNSSSLPRWLVYDRETGVTSVADSGRATVWGNWLGGNRLLVRLDTRPGIYDASAGTWSSIELGFDLGINSSALASPDGSLIALEGPQGELILLDMDDMTFVTVSTRVWLRAWSPDSRRLLVQTPGESIYFVFDITNLAAPLTLPTDSPALDGRPGYGDWIDGTRISTASGSQRRLAEVDLSGSSPIIRLGPEIEEGSISRSPDGNHFAVSRAGFQVSDEFTSRTVLYQTEPFELIAIYDGISGPIVWTADGSRIAAMRDTCTEAETLVMLDIATSEQIDLAPMGTSQISLSPNETLVAFGTSGLIIVPADGSAPAETVFEIPGAPGAVASPEWSPDGRFVSFVFGGYGRCP